jgi:ABC-2 type transport system permease protein
VSAKIHAAPLVRSELRLRWRSVLLWSVSTVSLVLLIVGVYPSVRGNTSIDSIYAKLSPTMQALLGGSDLSSPSGYLSTQLFAFFLPAVLLVFAVGRGASAIAGEEEDHTLDLLLAQPISRASAYLQKSAVVVLSTGTLTVASWVPLVALDSAVRFKLPVAHLSAACAQMGLFCCALACIAQAVATALGRRAPGIAVAAGYAVVSYVLYGLSTTVHALGLLRPLLLWRWYLANDSLTTGLGASEVVVLLAASALSIAVGAFAFTRRDLRA